MFRILPEPSGFGAAVTGIKLDQEISSDEIGKVRAAWLKHQVLYFPEQPMSVTDLERFTSCLGEFGDEPYVKAMEGHEHVIELRREPDEKAPPFGNGWHSDWSFQARISLETDAVQAGLGATEAQMEFGNLEGAVRTMSRVVELDHLNEAALGQLMKLLILVRRPASAVRVYRDFERSISRELGQQPSAKLRSVYKSLMDNRQDP